MYMYRQIMCVKHDMTSFGKIFCCFSLHTEFPFWTKCREHSGYQNIPVNLGIVVQHKHAETGSYVSCNIQLAKSNFTSNEKKEKK